jgi:putative polyhydroxyalkanoate system protein
MATIDMSRSHRLELAVARERAEALAKDMEEKLNITWAWAGDTIRFKATKGAAKGTNGQISVSTSKVRVEIDLPFLLRAMKRAIAGKVEKQLEDLVR